MLLFNRVVLWDCDRSSNFFSSLPFCTLLWKLLRVFAQGSLKLNPPPPHTQTHTRWNFPYICPPFFHPSLYSLLSAQNYKSQTGVHTHTILLLTHTHPHCTCFEWNRFTVLHWSETTVYDWERVYSHPASAQGNHQCAEVHERMTSTEDLFLSDHGSQELELKEKKSFFYLFVCFFKQKTPFWLKWKLEFCLWDYWELHSWALVMLVSCMIVSCWQEPSLCFGFPTDHSLYSEHSVWMKGAGAGNMSSGRFSHLLRGVWFLWQGEFKHWLRRS